MNVLYPRCAGLDLASDSLVAGIRVQDGRQIEQECRSFPTTTAGLLALSDWLSSRAVTQVAMEATGSYWKAVWHILEGTFELVLANPQDVKAVPGRKSDVNDALWLADLLAHGLIRGSFVPPVAIQDLRDLTRTRKQLVREIVQHTQRIQKTLDTANLKVAAVVSDILGTTGRRILQALISGQTNPEALADLACGSLKKKRTQLVASLHGKVRDHHRALLKLHLDIIEALEQSVAALDVQIAKAAEPFRQQVDQLVTIPGVSFIVALVILAEVGADMSRFPSAANLISWARLCSRLDITGGKAKSARLRKGGGWLKPTLVQAAWAAIRVRDSYLRSQYYRIRSRRGPKKAIVAVAASILTAAYHMLRNGTAYHELGGTYFDDLDRDRIAQRLVAKLNRIGYTATLAAAGVSS
jgi:transposase